MNNTAPVSPLDLSSRQKLRGIGAIIGSAVGDALGAPFEFGPAGQYTETFPQPVLGGVGEMIGGGSFNWEEGEFTDDTQLAVALAEALLGAGCEFDAETTWAHFKSWSENATDIGMTTQASLAGSNFREASRLAHESKGFSRGNGSVMRVAPVGVAGVCWGQKETCSVAYEQSALTHFDPIACWSSVVAAEIIRQLILGEQFEDAVGAALGCIDDSNRQTFTHRLDSGWSPDPELSENNGLADVCLAQAVWAIRTTSSFEQAVIAAIDLGDDTDTVAAVTGALAGALYGVDQIPARWVTYVHGVVTQPSGEMRHYFQHDLAALAYDLMQTESRPMTTPETVFEPMEVHEVGVSACNLLGAELAKAEVGIVSLCRMEDRLRNFKYRREFFLIDEQGDDSNPNLEAIVQDAVATIEAFLSEGREVLVHCHGGRSRTGLILKAWYMRRYQVDHFEAETWIESKWPLYSTWNIDFYEFLNSEW